jgi:hypothetical protein
VADIQAEVLTSVRLDNLAHNLAVVRRGIDRVTALNRKS